MAHGLIAWSNSSPQSKPRRGAKKVQLFNWVFRIGQNQSSGQQAKSRMRAMLIHVRLELPAGRLETMQEELVAVVSRYFELDKETTRFNLQEYERKAALIADFRLVRSKC